MTLNLVVPLYARFCLGSCKVGRNGIAVGHHRGTSSLKLKKIVSDHTSTGDLLLTRPHDRDGPEEHPDGVPAADGVAVLLEVGGEGIVVQRLDYVHPGVVQSLFWDYKLYSAVKVVTLITG